MKIKIISLNLIYNTIIKCDKNENKNIASLMNKKFFNYDNESLEKIMNNLLNKNNFYFILTILSLLFSYYINLTIGYYLIGFIVSFWFNYKNKNANLILIIIIILIIFLYYYTGIIYCEGGDNDLNTSTPGGDNSNTTTQETESTKAVILESKDHYHIRKDDFNKGVEFITQNINTGIDSALPHLGAASAAGTAANAVIKNSNLPFLPKLALTGITAAVVGASTKIGIATADSLLKNKAQNESITPSGENISNTGDEIQSPVNDFIHSVLENGDMLTPLEELLRCQLGLNVLMLVKIFILIAILYNKLFLNSGFSIIRKYFKLPDRFISLSNKMSNFNNKFFYILFIVNSLALIFDILLSIYITGELNTNLQEYIDVYNHMKN